MFHHGKLSRQHAVIYFVSMVILMVVLPYLSIKLFPALVKEQPENTTYEGELPDTVRIYRTEEDKYETIAFEDYIEGVVASEMPSSFEYEALKAQAAESSPALKSVTPSTVRSTEAIISTKRSVKLSKKPAGRFSCTKENWRPTPFILPPAQVLQKTHRMYSPAPTPIWSASTVPKSPALPIRRKNRP